MNLNKHSRLYRSDVLAFYKGLSPDRKDQFARLDPATREECIDYVRSKGWRNQ